MTDSIKGSRGPTFLFGKTPKPLLRDPSVSAQACRAYALLDDLPDGASVSHLQLAQWMGVSRATVKRALAELSNHGWLDIEHDRNPRTGGYRPSAYFVYQFARSSPVTHGGSSPVTS